MKYNKGFSALLVIMITAVLSLISLSTIKFGRISLNISKEKQILDTCSITLGKSIIETNDVDQACFSDYLNECASLFDTESPNFVCEDLGTECDINNVCERKFGISSTYNPGRGEVTKSVEISIPEETHDVDLIDAAVIMLLDYSGSMGGNRIVQLKNTVTEFINSDFYTKKHSSYAHFASASYYLEKDKLPFDNLAEFIANKIKEDHLLSIFQKLENFLNTQKNN